MTELCSSSLRADFGYWGGEEREKLQLSFLSSPVAKVCTQAMQFEQFKARNMAEKDCQCEGREFTAFQGRQRIDSITLCPTIHHDIHYCKNRTHFLCFLN